MSGQAGDYTALDLGSVRWRLPVAPLGFDAWMAMNRRLLKQHAPQPPNHPKPITQPHPKRALIGWALLAALSVAILAAETRFPGFGDGSQSDSILWPEWYSMSGGLLATGLTAFAMIAIGWGVGQFSRRYHRGVYERAQGLHSPTELILTENGLLFLAPGVALSALWSSVSDEFESAGTWFAVIEATSAVWTSAAALTPHEDAIRSFVRARMGDPA